MLKRLAFIAVVLVTLTCNEVKSQISPTHISIEPNFTTVSNNENVQFNCTADGGPNNMFIWTKTSDAININTNGTISVEDIQNEFTNISVSNQSLLSFIVNSPANEGGGYTCFVFNEAGIDSANAVLHVNPFIVTPPQPQYAEVGERPTFTCVGESFPSPTYQWQRISSSNVITTLTGEVSTTYRLPFVGYTSFASYQCIVTANGTNNTITSSPALITVSPRGSVVVLPSTQAVSRNGNASFICLAQGGPNNNIVWIRGNFDSSSFSLDAPVNVSYIINSLPIVDYDSSLSLTFVNGSDGGTYTCLVLNEAGVGSSSAILQVRPEIITDPVSTFTENGQSITFWCLADSFPSPQYYWERSNRSSNEFYIIPNENEQYLTIDSVVYEDNGRYRCNATAVMDTVRSNEAVLTISPSGSVEIDPGFTIATNGSTISFNCSARGGPNNSFFWTLSNATGLIANEADLMSRITMIPIDVTGFLNAAGPLIIENGTQLTLEYINATRNGGNYSCVVINEAGTSTVETTLYVAPIITLHPQDRLVTQGDNFMLSCLADAFPSPTYQWERMNQTSGNFEEITGKTSSNLRFNNVDFDEFGVYRCVASSEGITETAVSRGALVTVSPYGSLNATPATQIVSRNSSPTFTCEVSGGPNTTLVWIRGNGTNVQSTQTPIGINTFIGSLDVIVSETAPSLELSLQNVNGTNGGDYACIAVNEAGTDNGSVSLLIIPQILTNPVPQFVNVGQYLMLNCRADSFPAPNYQWEMMNRTSGYFEPLTGQTSYRLTLHIEYYLYGMYRCVATADGIEENGTSTPALVTVSPLDSVVVDPMNRTVSIGDTANFTCRAQGGPGNMFRWIKGNFNGPTLTAPLNVTQFLNSLSIFRSGYELSFTVGGGAADGGYYTCIVVNEAGYDTDNVSLLVRPQILTNPMPQYAEVGNNVTLTCEADSFPAPNYQWEMMNRTSGYFEHLNGQTSYVLILESISYEKYGMYRCVATTDSIEEKATSTPALVTVSPLDSVVADPEYRTVSINDTANFTCRAQGGPGNMFRWIKGNFTDPNLSAPLDVKQFLYNLSNITSDYFLSFTVGGGAADGGYYTCIVVNEAGYDTDNVSLLVRPQILTNPVAQYVNVDQQYVFLNCSADSFPAPNYQWEMMNRTSGYFEPLTGQTNYQLTLHIEYDLYGMYRCVATADGIKENATSTPALVTVSPLGSVNATPEYRTVSIGDTATFTCRAQGGPGNMFRWIKGIFNDSYQPVPLDVDKFLDDLDNITLDYFLSFTVSGGAADGGYYTCIVVNEAGYDTDNVTLYVSPVITLNPVDQYAHPGDTVIISCMADSYPPPTYQWQVLNTDTNMYENIPGATMSSYTIEDIDYDQFGMYRCAVTTPIINETIYSQPALITVSSNSSVTIDPDFIITENGSDVTFNCLSRGGPNNTFIWLRPSALDSLISNNPSVSSLLNSDSPIEVDDIIDQLSNITLSNEPTFTLYSINATEDGGNYACYVVNPAGVESNTTTLYVIPVITEDPREAFTNVSDTVTLNCRADSFPAPNYQWEMMNRTSGYFEPLTGQTSYQLTLNIEYDLYGMYRCVATADGIEENATSTPALVTVSPLHSARTDPNVTNSFVDTQVTFNCLSLGGPNNMYYWVYDRTSQRLSNVSELNVTSHASRGGSYTCTVSNEAGYDYAISTLNVAPEILIHPSPQNVTLAVENITLYCLVSGYPFPQVEWYLNDTLILPQFDTRVTITTVNSPTLIPGYDSMGEFSGSGFSDFSLGSGGDSLDIRNPFGVSLDVGDIKDPFGTVSSRLVIKDTTISDSGLYHCEAVIDNLFDDEPSQPALVLVQTVPDEPLNVSSVSVGSRYVNLTWIVPHHNNAPILGYYIFYQCPWFLPCTNIVLCLRWPFINIDFYVVVDLHPAVTYNFTMIAFNEEGNSSHSLPYSVQTLEEAPGGPPISVQGAALTETSISVVWQKPKEIFRHGVITSYDVRYTPLLDNCTEEEFEGIPANCSDAYVYGVVPMMTNLTGLYIFVNYSISVRAHTAVGPGPWSNSTIVMTDPHIPGPVPQPPPVPEEDIKSTEALVKWNPPPNANGVILEYKVIAFPLRPNNSSLNIDSSRRRRQAPLESQVQRCLNFLIQTDNGTERAENGTVLVTVPGTTLQAELTNLLPFSFYEFYVEASTQVGTSIPSSSQTFATLNDAPSNVENLVGSTLDSGTIILSWFSPPCPNDLILGYDIYYIVDEDGSQKRKEIDSSQYSNETLLATSGQLVYSITGLTPQRTYRIHVRAFSDAFIGSVDEDINVELEISVTTPVTVTDENGRPVSVADTTTTGISSINFFLPTAASVARAANLSEVIYYSLVVVPNPMSSFNISRDDFNAAYPNLQPYASRGSNSYYITAAWNNPDDVPNSFTVGDELTTTAVRNGTQESYFNAKLSRQTPYCVYIMVHGKWNLSNDTFVRVFEHTCIDTRLGYNLVALIVLLILAVLILCCLCWLLILLCICCRNRRRNRKQEYVFGAYNIGHQSSTIRKASISGGSFRESIRRSLRSSFRRTEKPIDEMVILASVHNLNEPEVKEPIPVTDFPTYVEHMHKNQDYLFTEEFSKIEPVHAPTRRATRNNKERNRFLNIAAYDHSRVVLENCPSGSDYINANYINGYDERSGSYIATQAPLASTVNDFWCMVWEKEAPVIVMLMNLVENDKEKCHQYWPKSATEGENVLEFSSFKVTLLEESANEHYTIRKLSIEMIGSNEKKTVDQYHFTSWPNHGTPSSSGPLLEFMDIVQRNYTPFDGPMVVHCSSGTGHTGTFIAIMVEMARIKSEKLVDIFNNVQYMRKCRPMMVMNENEYMFIHDALVEALKLGKIEGVAFAGPQSLEETSSERKSEGSSDKKNPADEETKL